MNFVAKDHHWTEIWKAPKDRELADFLTAEWDGRNGKTGMENFLDSAIHLSAISERRRADLKAWEKIHGVAHP